VAVGGGTHLSEATARPRPSGGLDTGVAGRALVLVVDREDALGGLVAGFTGQPLDLQVAHDPADALLLVGRLSPDVVVVGPVRGRLPLVAFLEVLREHESQLPVIVGVGAGDHELAGQVTALGPAAVVSHPYRLEHLLRLVLSLIPPDRKIEIGPLPIDLGRLRISGATPEIWIDGEHTVLPAREFLLLRFLAERAGRVVSRDEIGAEVWGSATAGQTNTLSVHIMRLRRRFGDGDEGARWITAVRGIGYQLNIPPARASE
jgi:DNA-binding response OmpR family regulator